MRPLLLLFPLGIAIFAITLSQGDGGLAGTPVAPTVPQGDADFLRQVRGRILQSQPFRADFVQRVIVDDDTTLEESGYIVFASRERVKWQYLKPEFKTFILDGDGYRFYDRENNQLLRGRLGERSRELVWEALFSDRPGQACRWDAGERSLTLALAGEGGIEELKIRVGADLLPRRIEQTAAGDVTTVYEFSRYRLRAALAPGEFDLDLPADVEIIEEQGP